MGLSCTDILLQKFADAGKHIDPVLISQDAVLDVFILDVLVWDMCLVELVGHLLALFDRNIEILFAVEKQHGNLDLICPPLWRTIVDNFIIVPNKGVYRTVIEKIREIPNE